MQTKHLGKISSIKLGYGGYQDAMFGLTIEFQFDKTRYISNFDGAWCLSISSKGAKWTEESRDREFAQVMRTINNLLRETNKTELNQLVGTPVEITLENYNIINWRVLKEVL